ncbi:MAG: hypothetical protein WA916_01560 [Arcobacter sp.]|uniref:hypothetical protein n=1 Tax=Arcobacter sp. TaxID=1872629 RepID=UPI003C79466D
MNSKLKDFNSVFWKIWGVNNRVYQPLDALNIKKDRQAEEKKYNNFLNDDTKLGNKEYLFHLYREPYIFYDLFVNKMLGNTEQVNFYVHQLNNIAFNFKLFQISSFKMEKFINMFSFQIALIIENMNFHNIDISIFNDAVKDNSLMPFINKGKENTKSKTLKDFATELSYINSTMKKSYEENNIFLEDIHPNSFQKELSKWKNNKSHPSLIKMLTIINAISKGYDEEKIGRFFQLLIIRALLHIQKEFIIEENIKINFLEQMTNFRKFLKDLYFLNNENEINEVQLKYLINMIEAQESNEFDINKDLNESMLRLSKFLKNNKEDNNIVLKMPNSELIINGFNNCKSKKDYKILLDKIIDIPENREHSYFFNFSLKLLRFIIAIKIEDKLLFNEKFKYLDRSCGTLLSQGGIEKKLTEYINILKGKTDLFECMKVVQEHFNKLSTLG